MITEELAKYDAGFATSVGAVGLAAKAVLMGRNEALEKQFADITAKRNFAVFCLTDPNAGSDVGAAKTTAVLDGSEWVLNGRKCFIKTAAFPVFILYLP